MKQKSSHILALLMLAIVVVLTMVAICASKCAKDSDDNTAASTDEAVAETASPVPSDETTAAPTENPTEIPTEAPTAVPEDTKIIAFTFDDGPGLYITPEVLEVLNKHGAHATFFELGKNLDGYTAKQNIMKSLIEAGNEIGSHSYSHNYFTKMTTDEMKTELNKMTSIVKEVANYDVKLFRPPYGKYNNDVLKTANMAIILWNVDSRDWEYLSDSVIENGAKENGITVEEERDRRIQELLFDGFISTAGGSETQIKPLAYEIKDGCIVLFHDIYKATPYLVDALLNYLEQNGNYKVVTVSELIELHGGTVEAGKVYNSAWAS